MSSFRTANPAPALDLTQVHEDYADFVWRTLQRFGVRPMDLEDALQEVFIVVHKKLASFDGGAKMTTWLFAICMRVAAAQRRRAHLRRERTSAELADFRDENPAIDPEQAAMAREAEARLERVLDALGLERRAVLVMFEIEGLPAGAIAEMLGVPVGTIYSRLSAARAEFKKVALRLSRRDAEGGAR